MSIAPILGIIALILALFIGADAFTGSTEFVTYDTHLIVEALFGVIIALFGVGLVCAGRR
jgi:hypothetical protein